MHSDLKILDPIWTTAYIVRNHGYMIYDTLFAIDDKLEVKPQMVDKCDGLATTSSPGPSPCATGSSGTTARRSPPRTASPRSSAGRAQDSMGQKLWPSSTSMTGGRRQDLHDRAEGAVRPRAAGARQAVVERAVHDAQARRRAPIPTSRSADYDRLRPVHLQAATNGSPARRSVYVKNPTSTSRAPSRRRAWPAARSPRSTASNGWRSPTRRPRSTRCSTGEIDMIEQPPHDLLPLLRRTRTSSWSTQPARQPVHLPLQHAAQAVRQPEGPPGRCSMRFNQKDFLEAVIGDPQVLQGLQGDVRLRHAAGQRQGHGGHARVQLRQGAGSS